MMPGMNVADFGSGAGHFALRAGQIVGSSGHVYAIDIQKKVLLSLANEARLGHMRHIDTVWSDLEKPNSSHLRGGIIDRALVVNILFQLKEKKYLIEEVHRVLRPHGKVLVIDWHDTDDAKHAHRKWGPDKKALVSEASAKALFERHGFSFEKSIDAGAHHYGLIFSRTH